jgi:hypothetical protein
MPAASLEATNGEKHFLAALASFAGRELRKHAKAKAGHVFEANEGSPFPFYPVC